MFVGSIREGLTQGLKTAVEATKQDSSNAAVHWMVGVTGRSTASSRMLGKKENLDLRETKGRGKLHPLIGFRGEGRDNTGTAVEVNRSVLDREIRTIINKYAAGQKPETKFYFYNRVGEDSEYADSARIAKAGAEGVARTAEIFQREINLGNTRRYKLK